MVPRPRPSAQAKSGSRLQPSPCSTAAATARRSGATSRRSPANGRPRADSQNRRVMGSSGAVGHPRRAHQPVPQRLQRADGRGRRRPVGADQHEPFGAERHGGERSSAGGGAGHGQVQLAVLQQGQVLVRPSRTGPPRRARRFGAGARRRPRRTRRTSRAGGRGPPPPRSAVQAHQHLLESVEGVGDLGVQLAARSGGLHALGCPRRTGAGRPGAPARPAAGWPPAGTGPRRLAPALTDPVR